MPPDVPVIPVRPRSCAATPRLVSRRREALFVTLDAHGGPGPKPQTNRFGSVRRRFSGSLRRVVERGGRAVPMRPVPAVYQDQPTSRIQMESLLELVTHTSPNVVPRNDTLTLELALICSSRASRPNHRSSCRARRTVRALDRQHGLDRQLWLDQRRDRARPSGRDPPAHQST
jgi:hypothetical protein